jgi:hypothetical protein
MRSLAVLAYALCSAAHTHAAVITVGAGGDFATLAAAVTAAAPNDEIRIFTGVYTNMFATITKPLTIVGDGPTPVLQAAGPISNGKAILIVRSDVVIRNIEFRDARVSSNNGAGIRLEAGDLRVEDSTFRNNQMGILTDSYAGGDVVVARSQFIANGAETGSNTGHAIYANSIASMLVEDTVFSSHIKGHDIKSRALQTVILDNVIDDGVLGTASYAIDLSNGGDGIVIGNQITQGPNSQNAIMVSYGAEGNIRPDSSLLVQFNTLANSKSGAVGVRNYTTFHADLVDNVFQGVDTPLSGLGAIITPFPEYTVVEFPADLSAVPQPAPFALLLIAFGTTWALRRRMLSSRA